MNEFSGGNRANEMFRIAVESSPCAMAMVDSEGNIVLVHAHTVNLFGYAARNSSGSP